MSLRLLFAVSVFSTVLACQCGGTDPCANVRCAPGLTCDSKAGRCVVAPEDGGAGGGTGGGSVGGGAGGGTGGSSSSCSPACTSSAPVCDPATQSCRICTETEGCAAPTPVCITYGNGGLGRCMACSSSNAGCSGSTPLCDLTLGANGECVACRTSFDCTDAALPECDPTTHTCVAGTGTGGGGGGWPSTAVWGADGGSTQHCVPIDAGVVQCTTECRSGFECVAGQCVLRGSKGPVQVTLRFPYAEDLDLHVVEPLPDGGTCEIWYGNPNTSFDAGALPFPLPFPIPTPQSCGAKGWLDLDSNPACRIDNVDTENVIYSSSTPVTRGTYIVRVEYYQYCSTAPVPYEVEVRVGNSVRYYCGTMDQTDHHGGNQGSGRFIADFTIP